MSSKQSKLTSLSVFFPCYNEEKNIQPLTQSLLSLLPNVARTFEIIIINDGSTDGTAKAAKKLAEQPNVRVVSHKRNRGYGASLRSGFATAKYEWVFYTDGDLQFDVEQLREFIPWTKTYQAIIGYRINRAEGSLRAFNARLFKLYVDLLFRVHVKDIDCAFKLYNSKIIKALPLQSTGAMISAEVLYRLKKQGIHCKQLPVRHLPRRYGSPTGNSPKVVLKAGYEALRLYVSIKFGHR